MRNFVENEENVKIIVKDFVEKYNFQLTITEYEIRMFNEHSEVVISGNPYYAETSVKLINPEAESRNTYYLIEIMRLRKLPFKEIISEELDEDTVKYKELETDIVYLDFYLKDILKGDFKSLGAEGYWRLPKLTEEDFEFIEKYRRFPN